MWAYSQTTGEFLHDAVFIGTGYSGAGIYQNDPSSQDVKNQGPIPQGDYAIGEPHDEIPGLGPCVFALTPLSDTNTYGRSDFYIHGDNARHAASHGCIILGPSIRQQIAGSSDRVLRVIA